MKPYYGFFFFVVVVVVVSAYIHVVTCAMSPSAVALLSFKSKADLYDSLDYTNLTAPFYCQWQGVYCSTKSPAPFKFILKDTLLAGIFQPNTLARLAGLRVLVLHNTSLNGPVPDLSPLVNLKVLDISRNYFSGYLPPSIATLHRLKNLDASYNMLSGPIPDSLNRLERLVYLKLDFNRFNGSIPALNQTLLRYFNVSHNDLTGPIPMTESLSKFGVTSFQLNPGLCGEIVDKKCNTTREFWGGGVGGSSAEPPSPAVAQITGASVEGGRTVGRKRKAVLVVGLCLGASFLVIAALMCLLLANRTRLSPPSTSSSNYEITKMGLENSATCNSEAVMTRIEEENAELAERISRKQNQLRRSGSLLFCAGEVHDYTVDQLMRANAEMLGRGKMGTTYKAVLESRRIVTVKRLDGSRLIGLSKEAFEGHLQQVGGLRHPNLVPLRAYFQAREERLLVYDYQANGSLYSLIHGSKSSKARPLHWTSCLKIAEDTAQGLSFIHQACRLVHGNLKSSNVLLGSDFEACLTDYCLVALITSPIEDEELDSVSYKAPELTKFNNLEPTSKSDVYSFGVLLLEILSGKNPSQHPNNAAPIDMVKWLRSIREEQEEDEHSGHHRLEMLLEVAMACRVVLPEQRPMMWQVLKMIQEIKEVVLMEDNSEFNF